MQEKRKDTFYSMFFLDLSAAVVAWDTFESLGVLQNYWEHLPFRKHDSSPFSSHTALPKLYGAEIELSSVTSPFLGAALFSRCPFTTLKWIHVNLCMPFCSKAQVAHWPCSQLAPARVFWEVQRTQMLMQHTASFSILVQNKQKPPHLRPNHHKWLSV